VSINKIREYIENSYGDNIGQADALKLLDGMELIPTEPPFPKEHIAYGKHKDGHTVYLYMSRHNGSTLGWTHIKDAACRYRNPDIAMKDGRFAIGYFNGPERNSVATETVESNEAFQYRRMLHHVREQQVLRELMP
jgi:hypothetical protein